MRRWLRQSGNGVQWFRSSRHRDLTNIHDTSRRQYTFELFVLSSISLYHLLNNHFNLKMKLLHVLPLVAVSSALVLPTEEQLQDLEARETHHSQCFDSITRESKDFFDHWTGEAQDAFSQVYDAASEKAQALSDKISDTSSDVHSWLFSHTDDIYEELNIHRPHHGDDPHHEPNQTVYQLIAGSKYTTKLAKLINEFDDLVEALNSTKGNYTVFAPTDKALDKIPEDAPKPSKKQLLKFLSYHVVPENYPAGRVLFADTAPTLLKSDHLGSESLPQRIAFRLGLKGLTVNFFSRVVAVNIFGTNGVVHGIDTPLFPPIGAIQEISFFPGAFSTLELGLAKTGLLDELNTTDHAGGTLFAPNNDAFQRLGPKANAFLFSRVGLKYLKALLQYHVVPENTLYSDAYYKAESSESGVHDESKGKVHVDLPTALEGKSLSIDIARYGPFLVVNVNGFNRVAVTNVVADDGVIHVMRNVIIPPKKLADSEELEHWNGEEISVDELTERLQPYVKEDWKTDL